jgi:hypothetical protein
MSPSGRLAATATAADAISWTAALSVLLPEAGCIGRCIDVLRQLDAYTGDVILDPTPRCRTPDPWRCDIF